MKAFLNLLRRVLAAALWIVLAVFAAKVVHDFFAHVDRAVYAAVDDGEAAIAYALASLGRYGFLPSPVLFDLSRLHGQFNYGPWYFYLAGALTWLFGYSLTLVRSIHLWAIVACAMAGALWFRSEKRVAPAAWCGFALFYFFEVAEWPMARPDSLVAVFTVLMIISAGLAFRTGRARWWFAAGITGTCAAFTHLVAASVLMSAGALFLVFAAGRLLREPRADAWRDVIRGGCSFAAGVASALLMFYASFGFGFATQWRFLSNYRDLTASTTGYVAAIGEHFHMAFWITPIWVQASVWLALIAGWVTVAVSAVRRKGWQATSEFLLPPLLVWTLYFASNGKYTNYHAGYGILHHVMFAWTIAALLWLLLKALDSRGSAVGVTAGVLACAIVLGQGIQLTGRQFRAPAREGQGVYWVPFGEYSTQVLNAIPARATAWGTVLFGIEAPDRIQLVQEADASRLLQRIDTSERAELSPEFLIRGYPEQRDDVFATIRADQTGFGKLAEALSGSRYRLASLVAATPYGVTHIYQRIAPGSPAPLPAPVVSFYDGIQREWLHRVGPPMATRFVQTEPAALQIGYEQNPAKTPAHATFSADLPVGPYLIKVALRPGAGASMRRMLAITPSRFVKQTVNEIGLSGDFSPYMTGDREVYGLVDHPGGTLLVSQFDDGAGAAIETVIASRVLGLIDPQEAPSQAVPMPALDTWLAEAGVSVTSAESGVHVEGNANPQGYQFQSPLIPADPGDRIDVKVPSKVLQGDVCVGAINGAGNWIIPAEGWRAEFDFRVDRTRGFRVVFANCQAARDTTRTRFDVLPGSYVNSRVELYSDRLVGLSIDRLKRPEPPDPTIITVPATLSFSRTAVSRAIEQLTPKDVTYVSPDSPLGVAPWTLHGRPDQSYWYLVKSKARRIESNAVLLFQGRLVSGGVTFGLLSNEKWAASVNLTTPGDFTIVIAPPSAGKYEIVVANNEKTESTAVVLERAGVLVPVR